MLSGKFRVQKSIYGGKSMSLLCRAQQLVINLQKEGVIDNKFCNVSYHHDTHVLDLMLLFINHTPDIEELKNAFTKEFGPKFILFLNSTNEFEYICFRVFN